MSLALLVFGIVAGCSEAEPDGDTAKISSELLRVVVIGPSTAETMLELGLGDRLVGVSDWCLDERVANLPRVGGQFDPNLELITSLDPDVVIVQGNQPLVRELCSLLQAKYLELKTDSLESWYAEVKTLAGMFDVGAAANELLNRFQSRLQSFRNQPLDPKPNVAILIGRDGARSLVAVGADSFLSELLDAAGGSNVFADTDKAYFDLSEEALLAAAPDVIVDISTLADPVAVTTPAPFATFRSAYPQLPAVLNNRLHALRADYIFLPGPRMLLTVEKLNHLLSQ